MAENVLGLSLFYYHLKTSSHYYTSFFNYTFNNCGFQKKPKKHWRYFIMSVLFFNGIDYSNLCTSIHVKEPTLNTWGQSDTERRSFFETSVSICKANLTLMCQDSVTVERVKMTSQVTPVSAVYTLGTGRTCFLSCKIGLCLRKHLKSQFYHFLLHLSFWSLVSDIWKHILPHNIQSPMFSWNMKKREYSESFQFLFFIYHSSLLFCGETGWCVSLMRHVLAVEDAGHLGPLNGFFVQVVF